RGPEDRALEELFAAAPAEFVEVRKRLVKELKQAGEKQAAANIGKAKKPSAAAWAVNRLARVAAAEIAQLVREGNELREAQLAAGRGGGSDALRKATAAERKRVDALVQRAERLLGEAGLGAGAEASRRLHATLHGAAVGAPALQETLRRGRFEHEL